MGGEWVVRKPSRSDEVLDAEQQLKITDQIRAHFDSLNPKRPPKPSRSETDSDSTYQHSYLSDRIPELAKFNLLSSQSLQQKPICPAEGVLREVEEDFVETHYYNELNSIDKQHHTTGSGFIRVSEGHGTGYELQLQLHKREEEDGGGKGEMVLRSNPATNDWT